MLFPINKKIKITGKLPAARLAALILCTVFISVSLFFSAYILTHINHEHDHDGPVGCCSTCMHIQSAEKMLRQFTDAIVVTVTFACSLFSALLFLSLFASHTEVSTLINLKVRLNN